MSTGLDCRTELQGKRPPWRSSRTEERTAQGSGGVSISGGAPEEAGWTSAWDGVEILRPASVQGAGLDDPGGPSQTFASVASVACRFLIP